MSENSTKKSVSLAQWSRDFPINVGEDNYVARRDFTKFMVLTSCAFAAGQAWIGLKSIADARAPRRPHPRRGPPVR